jgi:hypothetical protein
LQEKLCAASKLKFLKHPEALQVSVCKFGPIHLEMGECPRASALARQHTTRVFDLAFTVESALLRSAFSDG